MAELGKILIADDEEIFLHNNAERLREQGFQCDCASDGITALQMLREAEYDLLIADIKMEGNFELELIRNLPRTVDFMPVILVTGYPSVKTATQAIQLKVAAYLIKPFAFEELLLHVKDSIGYRRVSETVRNLRNRIDQCNEDLKQIEKSTAITPQAWSKMTFATLTKLTFRHICGALSDLEKLTETSYADSDERICDLHGCPKVKSLKDALSETIEVIERTKKSFKSKDLEELRKKLFGILKDI